MQKNTKKLIESICKHIFSKMVVCLVILLNVWFTDRVLDIFQQTASEPTVLISAWFTFTTSEILALASITKNKKKNKGDIDE